MAINQPGIAINIKGFLPTGKTIEEQFAALSIVKAAHETGDYSALLAAAHDVEVKTENKTRRIEVEEDRDNGKGIAEIFNATNQIAGVEDVDKKILANAIRDPDPDFDELPDPAPRADMTLAKDWQADPAPLTPEEQATAEAGPKESAKPAGRKRAASA